MEPINMAQRAADHSDGVPTAHARFVCEVSPRTNVQASTLVRKQFRNYALVVIVRYFWMINILVNELQLAVDGGVSRKWRVCYQNVLSGRSNAGREC